MKVKAQQKKTDLLCMNVRSARTARVLNTFFSI